MNTRVCLRSPEVPGFWPSIGAVSTMLTATNRSPLRFGVMFVVAVFTKGAEAMSKGETSLPGTLHLLSPPQSDHFHEKRNAEAPRVASSWTRWLNAYSVVFVRPVLLSSKIGRVWDRVKGWL